MVLLNSMSILTLFLSFEKDCRNMFLLYKQAIANH